MGNKISAIIIGYNEAKYVKRCLDNCAKWADEIIYFDSFSTDGSDETACSYERMKFFHNRYDNTRDQRNRALEVSTGDWNLILDVDEFLSEELIEQLPYEIQRAEEDGCNAIRVLRNNLVIDLDGNEVNMGMEPTIHVVKRGILHAGHPLHANRAHHPAHQLKLRECAFPVVHQKTAIQWMERARIYWWMCPYTFLPINSGLSLNEIYFGGQSKIILQSYAPPGSEDLIPPKENWEERWKIDVMSEFMDKGLDKRLTAGYLKEAGLIITEKGWAKR